jgi:hypothetical protein
LILLGCEFAFLRAIYRNGRSSLYLAWKKFSGYALPAYYFAHALPRVSWQNAGLTSPGRTVFLFGLTLLATAAGCAVFFLAGRPSSLAAAGVISAREAEDRGMRKQKLRERRKGGILHAVLDWVDAIAWAAIAVLIVNTFVFQLYEVPTESMVPTFLPETGLLRSSSPRVPASR